MFRKSHKYPLSVLAICLGWLLLSVLPAFAEYANETLLDDTDPAYWLDQGGLFATYGNYTAAVKAYQKAIELDAQNAEAFFDLGVSYAELADTDQALLYINKAILLDADQERYYYGRAWTLLIAGQEEKALEDFQKAADLGDLDAIIYLQQMESQ